MNNNYRIEIASVVSLIIFISGCVSGMESAPDFKTAVRYHLDSVENRDLATFKTTLTNTNELNVIFPGGGLLENTKAVVDFHEGWFKDTDWVFETEIVKIIEGQVQSTALVKYDYRDNLDSEPRQAWLVLTFQLEDNNWRLIHDQNTRIDTDK